MPSGRSTGLAPAKPKRAKADDESIGIFANTTSGMFAASDDEDDVELIQRTFADGDSRTADCMRTAKILTAVHDHYNLHVDDVDSLSAYEVAAGEVEARQQQQDPAASAPDASSSVPLLPGSSPVVEELGFLPH